MFRVIIWTLIGCLVMVPEGKTVSKFHYFLCWFVLILELITNTF